MLSSLPKLADKSFIIGFLLPTILFFVSLIVLFSDVPLLMSLSGALAEKDSLEKFVYVALGVWFAAIVLMMINDILFQILEGYRWPLSRLSFLVKAKQAKFDVMSKRFEFLREGWKRDGDRFPIELQNEFDELRRELITSFPSRPDLILPTRFGNAIRAFEDYSRQIYGADSIPLWLHLSAVIPKDFHDGLEDARAQVNCLLNLFFLSIIVVLFTFLKSLRWFFSHFDSLNLQNILKVENLTSMGIVVGGLTFAWLVYELSIERIYAWGSLVKAAFDCYLPELANKLGYKLPPDGVGQRALWVAVSRRAIYHRPFSPEQWPRADESTAPKMTSSRMGEVPTEDATNGGERNAGSGEKEGETVLSE